MRATPNWKHPAILCLMLACCGAAATAERDADSEPASLAGTGAALRSGLPAATAITKTSPTDADRSRLLSTADGHRYGNAEARFSVISYEDFHCPYCRRMQPVLRKLVNESAGRINWIFRHFPLSDQAGDGWNAAIAAECAAREGGEALFWRFAQRLYALPKRTAPISKNRIRQIARTTGIDLRRLDACAQQAAVIARIRQHKLSGRGLGVNATPTFVLLERSSKRYRIVKGAVSLARLKKTLRALVEE